MATVKLVMSGDGQIVRLPKEFRFAEEEVEIFRRGDEVVLRAGKPDMKRAIEALRELSALIQSPDDPPPSPVRGL